jgi:hypothetical protein
MKSALVFSLFLAGIGQVSASQHVLPRVEVLLDGVGVSTYYHSGTTYLEAVKGKEYAIRLTNPTGSRVAIALSVDGLNTIDARHTEAREARKWVLGPHESIVLSGWQTNQSQARRFFFTTEERSYGAWLGKTENLGIISAAFFREKVRRIEHPIVGSREPGVGTERQAGSAAPAPKRSQQNEAAAAPQDSADYAATGIGRRIQHEVQLVQMDLEDRPFAVVNLRYEFRSALVRLGVFPPKADPLTRRDNARGFRDSAYCPEP